MEYKTYPLSTQQEGVWFHDLQAEDHSRWTRTTVWEIDGDLDYDVFKSALKSIISEHLIYKTVFVLEDDSVKQSIQNEFDFDSYFTLSDISAQQENYADTIKQISSNLNATEFQLDRLPLIKFVLFKIDDKKHLLFSCKHHIISDATSNQVLKKRIVDKYHSLLNGRVAEEDSQSVQYHDYALWQKEFKNSPRYDELRHWWKSKIQGSSFFLELPGMAFKSDLSEKANYYDTVIGNELTEKIRNHCLRKRVIFSAPFLTSFYLLLHGYTARTELMVGTVVNGRDANKSQFKKGLGLFANTLPLKSTIDRNQSLKQYIKKVNDDFIEAYSRRAYLYEDLIRDCGYNNSSDILNPLFNVTFNLIKDPGTGRNDENVSGIQIDPFKNNFFDKKSRATHAALSLTVIDSITDIKIRFICDEAQLSREYLNGLSASYLDILSQVIENEDISLSEVSHISKLEREKVLYEFNKTGFPNPVPQCRSILDLIENATATYPDKIALKEGTRKITYSELGRLSNNVAFNLLDVGLKKGSICALLSDPSIETIIGILGILKAGGTYLAIDPELPMERIKYILSNCNTALVLGSTHIERKNVPVPVSELEQLINKTPNSGKRLIDISPDDQLYVIYTSGTTGKPKGTKISHGNMLNYITWVNDEYEVSCNDKFVTTTSFAFDAAYISIFPSLTTGAELHLPKKEQVLNAEIMNEYIHNEEITVIPTTPSILSVIVDSPYFSPSKFKSMRVVMAGGEKVKTGTIRVILDQLPHVKVFNAYGPTEVTIASTSHLVTPDNLDAFIETPVIGRPIYNTQIHILDKYQRITPIGVPGELCIAGKSVGQGYVNNEALTNEKFVDDPFAGYGKMYKTGDVARWLPNGTIDFIGRNDEQVKIKGFRIEKGEIESAISAIDDVYGVFVNVYKPNQEDIILCAYFTATKKIEIDSMQVQLEAQLPYYMLPAFIYQLDQFPTTNNGKIDVSRLPSPDSGELKFESVVLPQTEYENVLFKIWMDLFSLDQLSILDNFFLIGGNSVKAVKLIGELEHTYNLRLDLKKIFSSPTIKSLAKYLEKIEEQDKKVIPRVRNKRFELSSAQKRIYFAHQLNPGGLKYHAPHAVRIKGNLDIAKLENAFIDVIRNNGILRTTFHEADGEIWQQIEEKFDFKIELIDNAGKTVQSLSRLIQNLPLNEAPLYRIFLIRESGTDHILVMNMHHIISDATSNELLLRGVFKAYDGTPIENSEGYQFFDYVNWLKITAKRNLEVQKKYWINAFNGFSDECRIPYDKTPNDGDSEAQGLITFSIEDDKFTQLRQLSGGINTSIHAVLFTIYKVVLSEFIGGEDVVVGIPVDNRPQPEFRETLGLFINTLAIRSKPKKRINFLDYVLELNDITLSGHTNQDYPFDELVNELGIKRNVHRNPIFDTLFNYKETDQISGVKNYHPELRFIPLRLSKDQSNFDLRAYLLGWEDKIDVSFTFDLKLLREKTIQYLADQYQLMLDEVLLNPHRTISEFGLFQFNLNDGQLIEQPHETLSTRHCLDYKDPGKTILEYFDEIVTSYGQKAAVRDSDRSISYDELNKLSHVIANQIIQSPNSDKAGGQPVILLLDKGIELVAAILGVLRSNNFYVILDINYPLDRLETLVQASGAKLILTNGDAQSQADEIQSRLGKTLVLNLDSKELATNKENVFIADLTYNNDEIAYALYTSGSTGRPKCVAQSVRNLLYHVFQYTKALGIDSNDRMAWLANPAHDASVVDVFSSLLNGATLCSYHIGLQNGETMDLSEWLNEEKITIYHSVPTVFGMLMQSTPEHVIFPSMKYVVLGGEQVFSSMVVNHQSHFPEETRFVNLYGATEASIVSLNIQPFNELDEFSNIPIGYPPDDIQLIFGKDNKDIKVYGKYDLTLKSFYLAEYVDDLVKGKSSVVDRLRQERQFETGDIVRIVEDVTLQFEGRVDDLYKIKGNRVNLFEIEHTMAQYPRVKNVAACVHDPSMPKETLNLYFTSDEELSVSDLESFLWQKLPEYMIPSGIIQLEEIPQTNSGKVNRGLLPKIQKEATTLTRPTSDIQKKIAQKWSDLLNVERDELYCESNFFALGGHSLKLVHLLSTFNKEFDLRLSLKDFYRQPTISFLESFVIKGENQHPGQSEKLPKIKPVAGRKIYHASSNQKRLFALHRLNVESTTYNMLSCYFFHGEVDSDKLKESVRRLVERHESLRTYFVLDGEELIQKIIDTPEHCVDFFETEDDHLEDTIEKFKRPFDLTQAPLFRFQLHRLNPEKHCLLMDIHHIISDGFSNGILIDELNKIYNGQELEQLDVTFKDYTTWEQELDKSDGLVKQKQYWQEVFSGEIPVLEFPMDFTRSVQQNLEGDIVSFELSAEKSNSLKEICRSNKVTVYTLLLSLYKVLLSKYTGQEDLIVGTVNAGRIQPETQKIVGMFANTLALRSQPVGYKPFLTYLKEVSDVCISSFDNQIYPFERIIDDLGINQEVSRNPLFDTLFVLQNLDNLALEFDQYTLERKKRQGVSPKFDFEVVVHEREEKFLFNIFYRKSLFKPQTMKRFASCFENLIHNVALNSKAEIKDLSIVDEKEARRIASFSQTSSFNIDGQQSISDIIELHAEKNPDGIAVRTRDKSITYKELSVLSGKVANYLSIQGVGHNDIVALSIGRSPELIVSMVGVLKLGAGFLSLSRSLPEQRIQYLLNDSNPKCILTDDVNLLAVQGVETNHYKEAVKCDEPFALLDDFDNAETLAYLIYTSGTTGHPKGVQISQRSLINTVTSLKHNFSDDFNSSDICLSLTNASFDVYLSEVFIALFNGAELYLTPDDDELTPSGIAKLIEQYEVTFSYVPPSLLHGLCEQIELLPTSNPISLNKLFMGVEPISAQTLDTIYQTIPGVNVVNAYGPTETTIFSTAYRCNDDASYVSPLPIGKPILNTKVFIVDKYFQPSPIGLVGDLYIGGSGLSLGYLNASDEENARFMPSPFDSAEKLYKTGDRARWLANGNIQFLGRADSQLKIRGYRIEPGEVEKALTQHTEIKQAVVIGLKVEQILIAYYTSLDELPNGELRTHLMASLPEYMIPSIFIHLDEIPLTSHGKVDVKALSQPDITAYLNRDNNEQPTTETEAMLLRIFQEFFNLKSIGLNHDFYEIGGNSLKAMSLVARIESKFQVSLSLIDFMSNPRIKHLAEFIESGQLNGPKAKVANRPFFGQCRSKEIYYDYYEPIDAKKNVAVVICQSIGNESIVAKFTVSKLAEKIAEHAYPTLYFDFAGTGNSEGELSDFTVNDWVCNIETAVNEIKTKCNPDKIVLLGLRFGGLLSMMHIRRLDGVDKLILWEPLADGSSFIEEARSNHKKWFRGGFAVQKKVQTGGEEFKDSYFPNTLIKEIERLHIHNALTRDDVKIYRLGGGNYVPSQTDQANLTYQKSRNNRFWERKSDEGAKRLIPEEDFASIIKWVSSV